MADCSFYGLISYRTGVLLAVFSMSMSTSVVVREGQSVQMSCSHSLSEYGYTSFIWLKQTNQSPPVPVLTIRYYEPIHYYGEEDKKQHSSVQYHNGYSSAIVNGTVNKLTSTSALEIRSVSVSDSGLYYCGTTLGVGMDFYNVTYLTVTASVEESDAELTETTDNGWFCSGVCGTVVLVLGVLSAVLNVVLVILILTKHRGGLRQNTASGHQTSSSPDQVQDSDSMNYAALNFSAKKKRRSNSNLQTDNPHVIYAATR
ncbi:uncharacterized protein LOC121689835 [Alosa sapidissima]|uniref:uncharacterized protein LOC121689835 n=1 Tax=Alosa sapidissima TaxID=34773 RepID=UPI001C0858A5|nr:uncharacterized protein LOC121689835 [Alosa sapidissima]